MLFQNSGRQGKIRLAAGKDDKKVLPLKKEGPAVWAVKIFDDRLQKKWWS